MCAYIFYLFCILFLLIKCALHYICSHSLLDTIRFPTSISLASFYFLYNSSMTFLIPNLFAIIISYSCFLSPCAFVWWIILLHFLRHHLFSDSVLWENSLLLFNNYFFHLSCRTFKFAAIPQVSSRFIHLTFHSTSSCPLLFPLSPFNLFLMLPMVYFILTYFALSLLLDLLLSCSVSQRNVKGEPIIKMAQ